MSMLIRLIQIDVGDPTVKVLGHFNTNWVLKFTILRNFEKTRFIAKFLIIEGVFYATGGLAIKVEFCNEI